MRSQCQSSAAPATNQRHSSNSCLHADMKLKLPRSLRERRRSVTSVASRAGASSTATRINLATPEKNREQLPSPSFRTFPNSLWPPKAERKQLSRKNRNGSNLRAEEAGAKQQSTSCRGRPAAPAPVLCDPPPPSTRTPTEKIATLTALGLNDSMRFEGFRPHFSSCGCERALVTANERDVAFFKYDLRPMVDCQRPRG